MTDERTIGETPIQEIVVEPYGGKKNVIMDATVLTAVMSCPRMADLRFNHNLVSIEGKSNSLECGSIVHTFMETYYGNIIKGLKRDDAFQFGMTAALMYIQGCQYCTGFTPSSEVPKPTCGHKVDQYPGVHNTPQEPDTHNPREKFKTGWQWVLTTLEQYHNHYRNDFWVPLEVEVVKSKILYEDDEVRILWKAKLDTVFDTNQGIFPTDHKTMKQNRPTLSLNNQFMGQCLIMNTRNMIINKVGFQKTLKVEEKFIRPMVSYSGPLLLEWQSNILPYYAKLLIMYAETGYYPPQFDHCEGKYGQCAFVEVCKSDPDMREEEIKRLFIVGPEWNPINDEEGDD